MNRIRKIGGFLLSICILGAIIPSEVFAASASVSVSSTSGTVGSTVTIQCTASMTGASIGSADVTLRYEPSALTLVSCSAGASGSSGGIYYSGAATGAGQNSLSFSVTFKILKEGKSNIEVTNQDVSDWEAGASVPATIRNGTITGKSATTNNNNPGGTTNNNTQQDTRDNNSKLNSLQVNPGTLAPTFNVGTTSYTVTVPADTREVTIAATAQSSKATVSVSGGKDLKLGANEAKVVVTAENGSTSVYTLTIMCGEQEKIQLNGIDNTINEAFTDAQIPTGFVRDKITYNGREYEALKHQKGELTLVNLQNEAGNVFYIYDQKTQEFYNYAQVDFQNGRYVIPLWLDNTREFKQCEMITLTLQEKQFDAWKIDEEYSVIRVMNSDGEITFYQYDNIDGTLQRYGKAVAWEVEETKEKEGKIFSVLKEYHLYIIAGLSVLVLILAVVLIYFIATRKHRHQARRRRMQRKLEKQ